MDQRVRRRYDSSPYKDPGFMDALDQLRDEMYFMQGEQEARLVDRVSKMEKIVTFHTEKLVGQEVIIDAVVENVQELQESTKKNRSWIMKSLEMFNSNSQKIALLGQNIEQTLAKVEEGAMGSGSRSSAPIKAGVARDKEACPFCGKLLTVKYLKVHQKKWCKKAAAAARAVNEQEEAPEAHWVISHVWSLDSEGDEQC